MNILLFEPAETAAPLPRHDPRAVHLLDVLHRRVGDTFDAGLVNGPRGKGTLVAANGDALLLAFTWGPPPPPTDPINLIVGLPRPQTARGVAAFRRHAERGSELRAKLTLAKERVAAARARRRGASI